MSGHSKWATIKRKKGAVDAARGKVFTRLTREISIAARMGGGDPNGNARLRKAISTAKAEQMPSDRIDRALKRGTGEIEGVSYEEVLYEGTGPGGVLLMVEGTTDNKNRTVAELRKIFDKHNGTLGSTGTAAWAFDRRGALTIGREATEEQIMESAVEAGAEDYSDDGESWTVYTPLELLDEIGAAVEAAKLQLISSKIAQVPKIRKELRGRDAEVCLNLVEALDEHDDVATVYVDFDVPEEELQRIANAL
ncbi:MAG: YebC/PmpR family DNA-binding transcriptional regulator [Deltaproteobacteria bacterium]